jgi:hypothetical protein
MLSLERCRDLLGDSAPASDADLADLRDELYGMARYVIESWERETQRSPTALRDGEEPT